MLDQAARNLRHRIRLDTQSDHDRLDARFGALDLTLPGDLGIFFAAHRAAFAALERALPVPAGRASRSMIAEMVSALDADLAVLDGPAPPEVAPASRFAREAVDHIILGSRLGTAMLRGIWAEASDPRVRSACAYFTLPSYADAWKAHCADLKLVPADDATSDQIVADAIRLFAVFERALDAVEH